MLIQWHPPKMKLFSYQCIVFIYNIMQCYTMQFITMQKGKTTLRAKTIRIGYKESVATFVVEPDVHNREE